MRASGSPEVWSYCISLHISQGHALDADCIVEEMPGKVAARSCLIPCRHFFPFFPPLFYIRISSVYNTLLSEIDSCRFLSPILCVRTARGLHPAGGDPSANLRSRTLLCIDRSCLFALQTEEGFDTSFQSCSQSFSTCLVPPLERPPVFRRIGSIFSWPGPTLKFFVPLVFMTILFSYEDVGETGFCPDLCTSIYINFFFKKHTKSMGASSLMNMSVSNCRAEDKPVDDTALAVKCQKYLK